MKCAEAASRRSRHISARWRDSGAYSATSRRRLSSSRPRRVTFLAYRRSGPKWIPSGRRPCDWSSRTARSIRRSPEFFFRSVRARQPTGEKASSCSSLRRKADSQQGRTFGDVIRRRMTHRRHAMPLRDEEFYCPMYPSVIRDRTRMGDSRLIASTIATRQNAGTTQVSPQVLKRFVRRDAPEPSEKRRTS